VEELEFTVEDLKEGGEYEFRVKAVNAAGVSKPSATVGPVIVKDQTCKYQQIDKEFPLYANLHKYLITVQHKETVYMYIRKLHGVSVQMRTLFSCLVPQLGQNYQISLSVTLLSLKEMSFVISLP
jgi:hypothetical protein